MSDSKHPGGRPAFYATPEEMQAEIDRYFTECDEGKRPYTMTGLAYFLGFKSRQAVINYEHKEEFNDTVARARMRIEQFVEEQLFREKGGTHGVEFSLINNFGWEQKQKHEHSGGLRQTLINMHPDAKDVYDNTKNKSNEGNNTED